VLLQLLLEVHVASKVRMKVRKELVEASSVLLVVYY
jgi:hypothetical protein